MRFGFVMPAGDAREVADTAALAERSGWDALFVYEPVWGVDPWVALAAAAMRTRRIRLGTMLTPVSRRRPWKLAGETATLDRLSRGRVVLCVGLGAVDTGFAAFGEATDRRIRAELLDEGLEILTGLWRGQPFAFEGRHYHVEPTGFAVPPPPVQRPRIPIWVVGAWPSGRSLRRAARFDGLLPQVVDGGGARQATVEELPEIVAAARAARPDPGTPYDVIVEGETPGSMPDLGREVVAPWARAGATWWVESLWGVTGEPDAMEAVRERVALGPPPRPDLGGG